MKTGGTTVYEQAAAAFGDDRLYPRSHPRSGPEELLALYTQPRLLLALAPEQICRYALVAGHHPYVAVDLLSAHLGRRVPSISIVREPVDRAISHAKQLRGLTGDPDLPLEAIFEDERYREPYLVDQQTKVFGATADDVDELPPVEEIRAVMAEHHDEMKAALASHTGPEGPEAAKAMAAVLPEPWTWKWVYRVLRPFGASVPFTLPLEEGSLDRALANLERVDVLGTNERHDAFVAAVGEAFGRPLPHRPPQRVSAPEPVSDALRRTVEELNRNDLELYERARALAV